MTLKQKVGLWLGIVSETLKEQDQKWEQLKSDAGVVTAWKKNEEN